MAADKFELKIDRTVEVERLTGLGRVTIWRLVRAGRFPAPLQLATRAVGWRHADIVKWIATRPETAASKVAAVE